MPHQIGDANAVQASFSHPSRGYRNDAIVMFFLVYLRGAHLFFSFRCCLTLRRIIVILMMNIILMSLFPAATAGWLLPLVQMEASNVSSDEAIQSYGKFQGLLAGYFR